MPCASQKISVTGCSKNLKKVGTADNMVNHIKYLYAFHVLKCLYIFNNVSLLSTFFFCKSGTAKAKIGS